MPAIFYSDRALDDLDRLFDFIARNDPAAAGRAAELIIDAARVLERHPLIGRPVHAELRELLISHGRSGYVALYRFNAARSRVEILALRRQREAGYG